MVDGNSQIQALDRNAAGLVTGSTHFMRHGTTTLLAALDIAAGTVIGELHRRHLEQRIFLQFVRTIDANVPPLDVHLMMEKYGTHNTPGRGSTAILVSMFNSRPARASWLNQVESWFATLTEKYIRRRRHAPFDSPA